VLWLLVAAACSGGAPARPTRPPPPAPADAAVAPPQAIGPHPTDAECQALVAHAVDLAAQDTPAAKPTPAEAGSAAQPLRAFATECGSLSPEAYRCGMQAGTLAAFTACSGHPQ
jgi:hypothetical protein